MHMLVQGASGGNGVRWNPKFIQAQLFDQKTNWQLLKIQSFDI